MDYLLSGFLIGIFFAERLILDKFSQEIVWLMAGGLILVCGFFRRERLVQNLAFGALGLLLALLYFQPFLQKNHPRYLSYYLNQEITFWGKISDYPEKNEKNTQLVVTVKGIKGKILLYVPPYSSYSYNETLKVKGKLEPPPVFTDFDYQNYLKAKGIFAQIRYPEIQKVSPPSRWNLRYWLYQLLLRFEKSLNLTLPYQEAALANGLLLGNKAGFSDNLLTAFRAAGLIHLVALSGYNVTIIARGFHTIFRQIGPLGGFLFSLLGVWLFVLLVGAPPSLVRAAIMGSLLLLAEQLGRRRDIKRIVLLTAVIMVLPNPYILRYDIGFQLSFIATIAMIILVPLLTERIRKWPLPLALKEAAVSSFSAQIFVLPLLLLNFQKVALLAPLANVFVLPFIPLAMMVTFIIGVTGMLYLPLGQLGGVLGYLLLRYIILVGEFFGRLPWSQIETKTKGGWWSIFYWLIIYFTIKKIRQKWFK